MSRLHQSVLLSVDFDFFSREDPAWDWGHSEPSPNEPRDSHAHLYAAMVWMMGRYSMTHMLTGKRVDLFEETDPKHAGLLPEDFVTTIDAAGLRWYDVDNVPLWVADSHRHGLLAVRRSRPTHVLSFDAHHDMYVELAGRPELRQKNLPLNCGNWLALAMEQDQNLTATIVYPAWRREFEDAPIPAHLADRTRVAFIDEWEQDPDVGTVSGALLCRSPVWLPPHHDDAFVALVYDLADAFRGPVDMPDGELARRRAPTREEADAMWDQMKALRQRVDP